MGAAANQAQDAIDLDRGDASSGVPCRDPAERDRPRGRRTSHTRRVSYGGRWRRTAIQTRKRPGSTAFRTVSISPTNLQLAWPPLSIRWRCSMTDLVPSPPMTRVKPWRGRKPRPSAHASRYGAGIFAELIMTSLHAPSRRKLLLASGTLFAWAYMPRLALAEGRDPRFLTIVLRGALDGLATVMPYGDPDWASLRGDNALTLDGKTPALKLNDYFALNPAMPNLARMYAANEAIIVHACATPYRERSHFDGQDLLESGLPKPGTQRKRVAQSRACRPRAGRPGRSERQQGFCSRSGDAAGRARSCSGAIVVTATGAAGERRYVAALAGSLQTH